LSGFPARLIFDLRDTRVSQRKQGERALLSLTTIAAKFKILKDRSGQDLIEYALMAALVAFGAGAMMPEAANTLSTVFTKVTSVLAMAAQPGEGGPGSTN